MTKAPGRQCSELDLGSTRRLLGHGTSETPAPERMPFGSSLLLVPRGTTADSTTASVKKCRSMYAHTRVKTVGYMRNNVHTRCIPLLDAVSGISRKASSAPGVSLDEGDGGIFLCSEPDNEPC